MFGIKPPKEDIEEEGAEDGDIEAAIQRELESMKPKKPTSRQVFTLVNPGIECVVFVKTMRPVDPVELVVKICQDAKACTDIMKRKSKYINRLTPVSNTNRATESGIDQLGRAVLAPYFKLRDGADEGKGGTDADKAAQRPEDAPIYAVSGIS